MNETPRPDPWANVKRYSVGAVEHHSVDSWYASTEAEEHPEGNWLKASEVDAARAVVDARHQAEIAAKDETIGRWRQTGLTLMKFFAAFPVMNESDMPEFLWREVPTLMRSQRKEIATLRATVEQQAEMIRQLQAADARCATLTAAIEKAIADTRSDAQLSKNPIRAELLNVAHRFADALAAAPQGGTK